MYSQGNELEQAIDGAFKVFVVWNISYTYFIGKKYYKVYRIWWEGIIFLAYFPKDLSLQCQKNPKRIKTKTKTLGLPVGTRNKTVTLKHTPMAILALYLGHSLL